MQSITIPYHTSSKTLHVEEKWLKAILKAATDRHVPEAGEQELVRRALESPIGTPRLRELAAGRKKVVLVTSDHTRAVPSRITLPILLAELREGNPEADITILIATGLHRATTREEQRRMFGAEIVEREKILVNNAFAPENFVDLGILPSGARFEVNRIAAEADLLVTEGFIEPHFFAGFSGGRKSILPGICSQVTVNENHSYRAIASPYARSGILKKNPIHEDMVAAARRIGVDFILNVALNSEKEIIAAFAGDLEKAHSRGTDFVSGLAGQEAVAGDIVITSNGGYPLDQNLYQSPKAVATAAACCREGGVIIMCCGCADGMGGSHFAELITKGSPEEIDRYLSRIPSDQTIPEQWCAQIYADILKRFRIILVTDGLTPQEVRQCNMIPAASPDEALELAYEMMGREAEVVVIPDGVAVLAQEGA